MVLPMSNKKYFRLAIYIFLAFNHLGFSQTSNLYINMFTENSNKYSSFQKNFNPLKYDPKILKSCFVTMIDDIRNQLYGTMALKNEQMLDSVAQMQVDYQVEVDKLTDKNIAPYQYTRQRLQKYNFTAQGVEFVSKGKAHQGDKEYSYYDLCLELLRPLLKITAGSTPEILSPQFTIYGFASGVNKNMGLVYISILLGNDRTIQVFNSLGSKQKDLPISKGSTGLQFYDDAICKKCATDPELEKISQMLYWNEYGFVYLQSDDAKGLKKILNKFGNTIVLDYIQKEQYNCRAPQVDHNKPFRGIVSKPISIDKILSFNDSTDNSNKFHNKIGNIPQQIELTKPIDINILFLSNKKNVCRTVIKKDLSYINVSDTKIDSLISIHNYEEALYKLSPLLSDSTISDSHLFAIVQLAAHKEKTYLSSIFTKAVQIAILRNPQRLCNLLDRFSVSILDNKEVKKMYCNSCK